MDSLFQKASVKQRRLFKKKIVAFVSRLTARAGTALRRTVKHSLPQSLSALTKLPPKDPSEEESSADGAETSVWHVHRNTLHPPLLYRQAVVEDSDDITSVFNAQSLLQSQVYGQYFLAELIGGARL